MKFSALLTLLCFSLNGQAQSNNKIVLATIDTCYSHILHERREIWVRMPDTTGNNGRKKYPVVYLLDGDVLFYAAAGMVQFTGRVTGECPEMILVGITSRDRMHDLTPTHDATVPKDSDLVRTSGGGEQFTRFLENDLIPFVESHYPAAPYRVLIGHSLGGLLVVNTLVNHPALFNAYLAIDPAVYWDNQKVLRQAESAFNGNPSDRSLFVGWSGKASTNRDSILKDHSLATIEQRSQIELGDLMSKYRAQGAFAEEKRYINETHNTVPFLAMYDGLRSLFSFTKLPKADRNALTPEYYSKHYKMLSERMGYIILPPEDEINGIGYYFLQKGMFDRARAFFQLNINNYPDSYNVYDSMSDVLAALGDKPKAIEYLNKELKLKDLPYIRQKLAALTTGSGK